MPYRCKFKKSKGTSENSCVVKKVEYPNHIWTYDFISDQTEDVGRLRDDVLNREVFYSVKEAKVIVENWRLEYNNHRPHSGLGYMTPAAFVASCNPPGPAMLHLPDCRIKNMGNSLMKVGT